MKKAEKIRMYEEIQKHGENLNQIFNTGLEPVALCKKLRTLEAKAEKLAVDYCNGENGITSDNWSDKIAPVMVRVDKILNYAKKGVPVFLNGDPRGYALKIDDKYIRENNINIYRDWGGYGIIAPDFGK